MIKVVGILKGVVVRKGIVSNAGASFEVGQASLVSLTELLVHVLAVVGVVLSIEIASTLTLATRGIGKGRRALLGEVLRERIAVALALGLRFIVSNRSVAAEVADVIAQHAIIVRSILELGQHLVLQRGLDDIVLGLFLPSSAMLLLLAELLLLPEGRFLLSAFGIFFEVQDWFGLKLTVFNLTSRRGLELVFELQIHLNLVVWLPLTLGII